MPVYIHCDQKHGYTQSSFSTAYSGFRELGAEIIPYSSTDQLTDNIPEDIVVGFIGEVRHALVRMGISPPELGYPAQLQLFFGRRIWRSTVNEVLYNTAMRGIFMKPVIGKLFSARRIESEKDFIGCVFADDNPEVWCSEPMQFLTEWRCFIHYGKVLDVRRYKGDWRNAYDSGLIESAAAAYTTAPNGYVMDVGILPDGKTRLVEINEGYSFGAVGLYPIYQAKILSARWAELTCTPDMYR